MRLRQCEPSIEQTIRMFFLMSREGDKKPAHGEKNRTAGRIALVQGGSKLGAEQLFAIDERNGALHLIAGAVMRTVAQ